MEIRRRATFDKHILIATLIFGAWVALVMLSPFMVSSGALDGLSGDVFFLDNQEKISDLNVVPWTIYTIGDFDCHQLKERSFFLNDNQMPFCSRDVGIFLGLFLGVLAALFFFIPIRWIWVGAALIPAFADVIIQMISDYESSNIIRIVTGMIAGSVIALMLSMQIAMPELQVAQREEEGAMEP